MLQITHSIWVKQDPQLTMAPVVVSIQHGFCVDQAVYDDLKVISQSLPP